MSPSKARANEVERTPTTSDIFYSGHLQNGHDRPGMKQKYVNTDKPK